MTGSEGPGGKQLHSGLMRAVDEEPGAEPPGLLTVHEEENPASGDYLIPVEHEKTYSALAHAGWEYDYERRAYTMRRTLDSGIVEIVHVTDKHITLTVTLPPGYSLLNMFVTWERTDLLPIGRNHLEATTDDTEADEPKPSPTILDALQDHTLQPRIDFDGVVSVQAADGTKALMVRTIKDEHNPHDISWMFPDKMDPEMLLLGLCRPRSFAANMYDPTEIPSSLAIQDQLSE